MQKKQFYFLCAIFLLLFGHFFLSPQAIFAHAQLVTSEPANGAQVETPPSEVVINYSQGVQVATITVVDAEGKLISEEPEIDASDWTIVRVPLLSIGDGVYTVQWEALAEDGHTTDGSFFFLVGAAVPDRESFIEFMSAKDGSTQSTLTELVWQGVLLLGTILLFVPITLMIVSKLRAKELPQALNSPRFLSLAALLLIISSILLVVTQLISSYGTLSIQDSLQFLTTTEAGATLALRLVAGLLLLIILRLMTWPPIWHLSAVVVGLLVLLSFAYPSGNESSAPTSLVLSENVKGIDIQLEIMPLQVGMNLFDVQLHQNGEPIPEENIKRAALLLRHAEAELQLPQNELSTVEPGLYSALSSFTLTGRWRVRVGGMVNGKFITHTFLVDLGSEEAASN